MEAVFAEVKPTGMFDALGGDVPVRLLEAMPYQSTLYAYGTLTN